MSRIKICGLSRAEDIAAANRALPDYAGFVFAPSRRRISAETAAELKRKLDRRIKAVGVFVNEELETIAEICRAGIIDLIQLHGDEDGDYIRKIKQRCGCPVIKAVGIGETLPELPPKFLADYLLFDTLSAARGGTGKAFDHGLLKGYGGPPYFLAGGLNAGNVAEAIRSLRPFCVDVSSGAETDGVKDAGKIIETVETVRGINL
jgi:phosphoribosylanthranilate isomerase